MIDWLQRVFSDPAYIPVIVACVAAVASIAGAVITIFNIAITARTTASVANRAVYINSVTAERSKWIDALRESIADYSGAAERVLARREDPKYVGSVEWATDVQSLRTHMSALKMRLNPRETIAQNLIDAARKLDQAARIHRWADMELASEIMVRHGQWILKYEWNRVKLEAASGKERDRLEQAERELDADYAKFLQKDGSMERLKAIGVGKSELEIALLRSKMDVAVPDSPKT
ncbi:hypothetical protein [Aurantimonas sp. NFXS3]|uniref:hypothetical protein n=1 Tax=Aurantimonas sp. NFXS3 TaxID=2818434 RepID=UPI003B8B14D6